jgi:hypothetical protein
MSVETEYAELLKRLRQSERDHQIFPAAYDAAVAIEALLSENERLKEAILAAYREGMDRAASLAEPYMVTGTGRGQYLCEILECKEDYAPAALGGEPQ